MARLTKRYSCETHVVTFLAIAALLISGVATAAEASGGQNSSRSVRASEAFRRSSVAKPAQQRPAEERETVDALRGKRDPFRRPPPPVVGGGKGEMERPLPPGSRGLVIGRLELKGIVREDASNTMIAVVTNPSNLAYFLHVHDRVYNGVVTTITADSIHFAEDRLDAGGRGRVETRVVVLKLGSGRQEAR